MPFPCEPAQDSLIHGHGFLFSHSENSSIPSLLPCWVFYFLISKQDYRESSQHIVYHSSKANSSSHDCDNIQIRLLTLVQCCDPHTLCSFHRLCWVSIIFYTRLGLESLGLLISVRFICQAPKGHKDLSKYF